VKRVILVLGLLCVPAWGVHADTHLVRPDGTGDFPTIQAAIDAAVNGDAIELADGTFRGDGNRDLDYHGKTITVRSQGGDPASCIIDCEGSLEEPHRGLRFHSGEGPGASLRGVTISGGYAYLPPMFDGGAVHCVSASPTFFDCVFSDNYADNEGGALYASGGSPVLDHCVFSANSALSYGGGALLGGGYAEVIECSFLNNRAHYSHGGGVQCFNSHAQISRCSFVGNWGQDAGGLECSGGAVSVDHCTFQDNVAAGYGGAVQFRAGTPSLSACIFVGNDADIGGGLSCFYYTQATVTGCTFYGNNGDQESIVHAEDNAHLSLENTIVAFGIDAIGVRCTPPGTISLICCDIYGNEMGDWVEHIADQLGVNGNICEDPLFCGPQAGDLGLASDSPCAAQNNPECGQIGAWPVECGSTPAQPTTWGALKSHFR
jgi:predicted outer membrane repeat protein